jgi:hypothetical protein
MERIIIAIVFFPLQADQLNCNYTALENGSLN